MVTDSKPKQTRPTRLRTVLNCAGLSTATLLVGVFVVGPVSAYELNLVSDESWTSSDETGPITTSLVCLNTNAPAGCPAQASIYGFPDSLWLAPPTTGTYSRARWIWAGDVSASARGDGDTVTFEKSFYLCDAPVGGSISIAVDDFAEVKLNGQTLATTAGYWQFNTVQVPASALRTGENILTVVARNGAGLSWCRGGEFRCNPAGVLIGATFRDAAQVRPTCTGSRGTNFELGASETLSCPPGTEGRRFRICGCAGSVGLWSGIFDDCRRPTTTCVGNDGNARRPGEVEQGPCPAGLTGATTRTCTDQGWGPTSSVGCTAPNPTCTALDGAVVQQGGTERVPCPNSPSASQTRSCGPGGVWTSFEPISCPPPLVGAGGMCRDHQGVEVASCPPATTCAPRPLPRPPRPWWCILALGIPEVCRPQQLRTAEWFCD
jgi:hypothetical protein